MKSEFEGKQRVPGTPPAADWFLRIYKTAEANPVLSVHTFSIGTFVHFSVKRRMEWTGDQKNWILTSALLCDDGQVP